MRSAIVILLALAAPASAQTATPAAGTDLSAICSGVLDQSAGGVSGDHTKLCACLARETPARLSQAEMMAYAEATLANKAPPDAVTDKITAIATHCLQQAR
jgi:hypothetical protein